MGLEEMAGAKNKIVIEGREYELEPLRVGSLVEFSRYFKEEEIKEFKELAQEGGIDESEIKATVLKIIMQKPDDIWEKYAASPQGIRYILWQRLKKNYTEITLNKVGDFPIDVILKLADSITDIGGESEKKEEVKEGAPENSKNV